MGSLRALAGPQVSFFFYVSSERTPKTCFVAFVLFIHISQYRSVDRARILLPLLCRVYKVYVYILHGAFVALDILEV